MVLDKENRPQPPKTAKTTTGAAHQKRATKPYKPGKENVSAKPITPKPEPKQVPPAKAKVTAEPKPIDRAVMQEVNPQVRPENIQKPIVPQPALPLSPKTPANPTATEKKAELRRSPEAAEKTDSPASSQTHVNDESPDRSNIYVPPAHRLKTPEVVKPASKQSSHPAHHSAPQQRGPFKKNASSYDSPPTVPSTPQRQYARQPAAQYSPGAYYNDFSGAYQQHAYPPYTPHPAFYEPAPYNPAAYPCYATPYGERYAYPPGTAPGSTAYDMSYAARVPEQSYMYPPQEFWMPAAGPGYRQNQDQWQGGRNGLDKFRAENLSVRQMASICFQASSKGTSAQLPRQSVRALVEHQLQSQEPVHAPWYRHRQSDRSKPSPEHAASGTGVWIPDDPQ